MDGVVVVQVSDVRTEDADLDGLTQEEEEDIHGSSDLLADTDADGHTDTAEAFAGSDAADPWSTPLGVLGRAVALGDGWRSLDWLGTFQADNFPWLYHMGLGWIYPIEAESDDLWIWLPEVGWVWADAKVFPQMYDSRAAAWLYLDAASGDLYRYQAGEWVKL